MTVNYDIQPEDVLWMVERSRILPPPPTVIEITRENDDIYRVGMRLNRPWTQNPWDIPPRPETPEELLQRLNDTPARESNTVWFEGGESKPKVLEKHITLNGIADMVGLIPLLLKQETDKVFSGKAYAPVKLVDMSGHIGPMRAGSQFTVQYNETKPDNAFTFQARQCSTRQRAYQACWERPAAVPARPTSKPPRKR
jgi:hypothetical protein